MILDKVSTSWNQIKILLSILLIHVFSSSCDAWKRKQKVCVIGAGPAGLTSTKQLADNPNKFDVVVFEKSSEVASFWNYTAGPLDEHNLPVHSSIYESLRTNGPKEIQAYPDYRNFSDPDGRSCVAHETALNYFKNFTDNFNLRRYIQFNTLVENLTPYTGWRTARHVITTRNLNTNKTSKTICDAVMICHGNNVAPNIPEIPGLDGFPGVIIHSHNYRVPQAFSGQTVLVLGVGTSGADISIDVSVSAKKVYLSHNRATYRNALPTNIEQVAGVSEAIKNTLVLRDGSNVTVDAIIFCTGYRYNIPFLDESNELAVESKYVHPLYKHIVSVQHPTIALIGIPTSVIGFPTYYVQAKYFIALLKGDVDLPDKQTMLREDATRNSMQRRPHDMIDSQWAYYDELAENAHFEPLPKLYEQGFKMWYQLSRVDLWHFKDFNLVVKENGDLRIVHPNGTII